MGCPKGRKAMAEVQTKAQKESRPYPTKAPFALVLVAPQFLLRVQ